MCCKRPSPDSTTGMWTERPKNTGGIFLKSHPVSSHHWRQSPASILMHTRHPPRRLLSCIFSALHNWDSALSAVSCSAFSTHDYALRVFSNHGGSICKCHMLSYKSTMTHFTALLSIAQIVFKFVLL